MSKVLFFHTPNIAEIINVKEKDGAIIIGDKKFWVDETPEVKKTLKKQEGEIVRIMLKKTFGYEPLYFLKWDCIYPGRISFSNIPMKKVEKKEELRSLKNIVEGKQTEEKIHLASIIFHRDLKNIPESLYRSEKLKILGGMFKIKREIKSGLILILGIIIGIFVTFLLSQFKIIRI